MTSKITSDRIERFRELTKVNLKYLDRDWSGAARDFYLHIHEIKTQIDLVSEDALHLKNPSKDHLYRPEAFFQVFVQCPELLDTDIFPAIYRELGKIVRVTGDENKRLRGNFGDVLTSKLYAAADIKLMKRQGRRWSEAVEVEGGLVEVPEFMEELERTVLGRV